MSESEGYFPTELVLREDASRLVVTWDDDHESDFPLSYLRGWCPCAHCQGHFSQTFNFVETNSDPTLDNALPVGNYAVQLIWAGHDTGIYPFDYLRGLCVCSTCDPQQTKLDEKQRQRS